MSECAKTQQRFTAEPCDKVKSAHQLSDMLEQLTWPTAIPGKMLREQSLHFNASFLSVFHYASESEVDAWCFDLFSDWKTVIPVCVCGIVHEQKTPVSQLQLQRLNLTSARTSSCILMSENKVTGSSKRYRGNRTGRIEFPFIIPMLSHVIVTVFIPNVNHKHTLLILKEHDFYVKQDSVSSRKLNYLFIKTKLNVCPVALVTASRMCSKVGVHGLAWRWTPEKEYISPSSPYVACFLGTLYDFPNTCILALSPLSHEKMETQNISNTDWTPTQSPSERQQDIVLY